MSAVEMTSMNVTPQAYEKPDVFEKPETNLTKPRNLTREKMIEIEMKSMNDTPQADEEPDVFEKPETNLTKPKNLTREEYATNCSIESLNKTTTELFGEIPNETSVDKNTYLILNTNYGIQRNRLINSLKRSNGYGIRQAVKKELENLKSQINDYKNKGIISLITNQLSNAMINIEILLRCAQSSIGGRCTRRLRKKARKTQKKHKRGTQRNIKKHKKRTSKR